MAGRYRFAEFELDPGDRRLSRAGAPVELNARYLDALVLLAAEQGRLVSKDRFLEQVWRGVPVTDEALTQCIRTLRRQLGDDAANPRFIETVPKHGYRFLAQVEIAGEPTVEPASPAGPDRAPLGPWQRFFALGVAATAGGGVAGAMGGLLYGFAGASQPLQPGVGALSVLLVVAALSLLVGMAGGAGVGFGIAAAGFAARPAWYHSVLGGAAGGLLMGAVVKLLGLDAFNLLFGAAPRDMTGAAEGTVLGGAVGLAAWLAGAGTGPRSLRLGASMAALAGAAAGAGIALLGGRLMAGSLDLLARSFPNSRLRLDPIGQLLGEGSLGPVSLVVTSALEGALLGGCVVGAMIIARKTLAAR
ncbi:MAG TPA: transcriptional regulator [Croceibacterium sp.]